MTSKITNIISRQILDSRGTPTVETDVILDSGAFGRASVPSGASTGSQEAVELRDKNKKIYLGKSVLSATNNVNKVIKEALLGVDALDQRLVDQTMTNLDGTINKSKLGANAILSVSVASARAAAAHLRKPFYRYLMNSKEYIMPVPMINIINGGKHANNNIDIQEFMIVPVGFERFSEALRCGADIFHNLKSILLDDGFEVNGVGDEGGYAPNLPSNESAIQVILKAIEKSGYSPGKDVFLALDIASSEIYKDGKYSLASENISLTAKEFVEYLKGWVDKYPIISIEDAMEENDIQGWKILTESLGKKIQLVGDDVFVTNTSILKKGISEKIGNSILIKPNQVGTLTETFETMAMAADSHYTCVISHRSGETSDTTIADIAVATGTGQIKTGSICRSDRVGKYNQLLRIEEELGKNAIYPGIKAFNLNEETTSQPLDKKSKEVIKSDNLEGKKEILDDLPNNTMKDHSSVNL